MRALKVVFAVLMLLLITGSMGRAQIPPQLECTNSYLDCADVSESTVDTVRIVNFQGRPGDTVWMPIYMHTREDTVPVSGFNIIVQYDRTWLTPVKASADPVDSLYVKFELVGELLAAQQRYWAAHTPDSEWIFSAAVSQNPFDSGSIICGFNLATFESPETIPGGKSGSIFRLAFRAGASMPNGTTAQFKLYDVNEYIITDTAQMEALCVDCRRTNLSVDHHVKRDVCVDSTPVYDSLGHIIDYTCTEWVYDSVVVTTATLYPKSINGTFTANIAPPPTIVSWISQEPDDSVGTGDPFDLTWSVDNTDSIEIWQGANFIYTSKTSSGSHIVYAPSVEGSYTYTLWAFNQYDSVSASLTMKVQEGGVIEPHAPTITVNSYFSVEVGSTLNFSVSATDPDGDPLTLEATNLPTGAKFPTVTGVATVSGSFSWTPGLSQAGIRTATFRARDQGGLSSTRTVTIEVTEPEYDKLFTSSVVGSAVGGLPGKTGLELPVNLVTYQTVYGVQFDLLYNAAALEVTGVNVTPNTADYVVYENIGVTPGKVRFVTFGMANEPIGTEGTDILMVTLSVDNDALPGVYPVYFDNAWESVNPDPTYPSLALVTDSGVVQVDAFGDVNLDTRINVADLVSIVGYIIGDFTLSARRFDAADIVKDGMVDVFDLVAVVNLIYGLPISPAPGRTLEDRYAVIDLDYEDLYSGAAGAMVVRSEMPVDIAGVQLEIRYDPATVNLGTPQLADDVSHLALRSRDDGAGLMTILMYFTNPFAADEVIAAGRRELVVIPLSAVGNLRAGDRSQLQLSKALLATSDATAVKVQGLTAPMPAGFVLSQNYPNPFNPSTTIEFTLGAPGSSGIHDVRLDIFNILGQEVKQLVNGPLPAGNHQVVWDGTDDRDQRVASGIYLYKLQVGPDCQTRKMLLLK